MAGNGGLAVHITSGDLRLQSRIDRVTRYLKKQQIFSTIEIVGIRTGPLAAVEIQEDGRVYRRFAVRKWLRETSRIGRALDFLIWYLEVLPEYLFRPVACVNAHTLSVLPLCWALAKLKRCKLIYEPHELETETMTVGRIAKIILSRVEGLFIRGADCVIVVNEAIAQWYRRAYRLSRVYVVRNLPSSQPGNPMPQGYFASRFGFDASHIVLLYQGLMAEGRGMELLLSAAARLAPDRHIVFLGHGAQTQMIEQAATRLANVHYHPAVPNEELLRYTAAADIGLLMPADVSLSYRLSYPNKFCEYLTAGIPVICSDFLWLCTEVARYDCGWSSPYDADALASLVAKTGRDDIGVKKIGAAAWARDNKWEYEENILEEIYGGGV